MLGRARTGTSDSRRTAVVKAPADVEGLAARSEDERAAWDESIHYYAADLSTKDMVFDAGLVAITSRLVAARDDDDPAALGLPTELAATLKLAAPVYRAVWWPRHSRANAARRDDLQAQVDAHGAAAVRRLTALYQTRWPSTPQVINLAAYTNWAGAYSITGGLIAFATEDQAIAGAQGFETLLHESSHQWDDEIDGRLTAIAKKQGKPLPSLLSHALIFYTSGEIVSELVPGHVGYAGKTASGISGGSAPSSRCSMSIGGHTFVARRRSTRRSRQSWRACREGAPSVVMFERVSSGSSGGSFGIRSSDAVQRPFRSCAGPRPRVSRAAPRFVP